MITEQDIHALDVMNWVMKDPPLWAVGSGGRFQTCIQVLAEVPLQPEGKDYRTEVLRVNMTNMTVGSPVTFDTIAVNAAEPVPFVSYYLPNPATYLSNGVNVVAVQVFQSSTTSSDLGFDASLEATLTETIPPTVQSVSPLGNAVLNTLTEITVNLLR
jgi:hypothetical protein